MSTSTQEDSEERQLLVSVRGGSGGVCQPQPSSQPQPRVLGRPAVVNVVPSSASANSFVSGVFDCDAAAGGALPRDDASSGFVSQFSYEGEEEAAGSRWDH